MGARTLVVDSSAWIDFFRRGNPRLAGALERSRVFVHDWVVYELELGAGIPRPDRRLIAKLPRVGLLTDGDAWRIAEPLRGMGVGWVDIHVLAATHAAGFALMTLDEPLRRAARHVRVPVAR